MDVGEGATDAVALIDVLPNSPDMLTVIVESVPGTAQADADYVPLRDTLHIVHGMTRDRVRLATIDNAIVDTRARTYSLVLSIVGSTARDTLHLSIIDNDAEYTTQVTADPMSIDFDSVNVGIMAVRQVKITNKGTVPLRVRGARRTTESNAGFDLVFQPSILVMDPDGTTALALGYTPPRGSAGTANKATVIIQTTLGGVPVQVTGRSIDTIPPTINLAAFRANDTLTAGTAATFRLSILDNDIIDGGLIEYVSENGQTHGDVYAVRAVEEMHEIPWAVPASLAPGRYHLQIRLHDRMGNASAANSPAFVVRAKQ